MPARAPSPSRLIGLAYTLELKESNGINMEQPAYGGGSIEIEVPSANFSAIWTFGPPKFILLFWRGPIPDPIKSSVGYLIPNTQILGRLGIGYG